MKGNDEPENRLVFPREEFPLLEQILIFRLCLLISFQAKVYFQYSLKTSETLIFSECLEIEVFDIFIGYRKETLAGNGLDKTFFDMNSYLW